MKRGGLAAATLAAGVGAATSTATAQEDEEAVVSGDDYYPDVDFDVVAQFEDQVKDDLLGVYDDEFDDPEDWEAYAIDVDVGGTGSLFGCLFVDEEELDVSVGDSGTFEDDASVRSSDLKLIEFDPSL